MTENRLKLDTDVAIFANTQHLLLTGFRSVSSDGSLLAKRLDGRNGHERLYKSPLVKELKARYPKRASEKISVLRRLWPDDWNRLEISLSAVGATIVTCPSLSENFRGDLDLLIAFDKFKVFWVNFCLMHSRLLTVSNPEKEKCYVLPNLINAINTLKDLANWFGWYAAGYPANTKPPINLAFPRQRRDLAVFPWMGGCLAHLSDPSKLEVNFENTQALVQCRTFGRALPCGFGKKLDDAVTRCVLDLSEEVDVDYHALQLSRDFCELLGARLPLISNHTHTSVNRSSSYDCTRENGGAAGDVCPMTLAKLDTACAFLSMIDKLSTTVAREQLLTDDFSGAMVPKMLGHAPCGFRYSFPPKAQNLTFNAVMSGALNMPMTPQFTDLYDIYGRTMVRLFHGRPCTIPLKYAYECLQSLQDQEIRDYGEIVTTSIRETEVDAMIDTYMLVCLKDINSHPTLRNSYTGYNSFYGLMFYPDLVDIRQELYSEFGLGSEQKRKDIRYWMTGSLGYLLEQASFCDLAERGIIEFSIPPTGRLGEGGFFYWSNISDARECKIRPVANPPCRLKSLGEPGFKARPLTIGLSSMTTIAKTFRFAVEPSFNSDYRIKIGFQNSTNILWNYIKILRKKVGRYQEKPFLSINTDLESATDTIILKWIRESWEGFFDGQMAQGLKPWHPAIKLLPLMTYPHLVEIPDCYSVSKDFENGRFVQRNGSFMGTAQSFLTLSLFSLTLDSLAYGFSRKFEEPSWEAYRSCNVSDLFEGIEDFRFHPMTAIVGDDNNIIGEEKVILPLDRWHRFFNNILNGRYSKGKDLLSKHLLILCEEHIYWDNNEFKFIDIVRIRLLGKNSRHHMDARSSILGKGEMVAKATGWNENNHMAHNPRVIYIMTFSKVVNEKKFLGSQFPWELRPNLGGISYPGRDIHTLDQECPLILRFIQWVLDLPFERFLYWAYRLNHLNVRVPKGVREADLFDHSTLLNAIKGFTLFPNDKKVGFRWESSEFDNSLDALTSDNIAVRNAARNKRLFSREQVIRILKIQNVVIPVNPTDEQPINSVVQEEARKAGFITLNDYGRQIDRLNSFSEMFEKPGEPTQTNSFARYQRNLFKFWRDVRRIESEGGFDPPLPTTHKFKDLEQPCEWIARKGNVYLSTSNQAAGLIEKGPSLRICLTSGRPAPKKPRDDH